MINVIAKHDEILDLKIILVWLITLIKVPVSLIIVRFVLFVFLPKNILCIIDINSSNTKYIINNRAINATDMYIIFLIKTKCTSEK